MKLRKSYIIQMFTALLALFILLLCATGVGIYVYARKTVGAEFRRLNQASLTQLADATGKTLSNVISFGEKVSVSSRILQCIEKNDENSEKEIHSVLTALQAEFNEFYTNGRFRMEVAVIGRNGVFASASNSERQTWEQLQADARLTSLLEGEVEMLLLPTMEMPLSSGIMTYSFQIVYSMRDLLDGEHLGCVVVDVSELFLFEQYRDFLKGDVQMCIIAPDGQIISDNNKQRIGSNYGMDLDFLNCNPSAAGQMLLYERVPGTEWLLVESVPEQTAFGTLTKLKNAVSLAVVITTVLFAFATAAVSRNVSSRVMRIRNKMKQVIAGDLTVRINTKRDDELGQIEQSFNSMVSEIDRLITSVKESEHQKRIAEMDFLHAQINSHFIHNTLTSIRFMLEMGQVEEAGEMVFYFSKLLRKTLSRSAEFIPLADEIDTLKSYVNLQKHRYPNKFDVFYDIPEEMLQCIIPALILQPVVENAIFHATGHDLIRINIYAKQENDKLIVIVQDDGVGMTKEKQSTILKKDAPLNRVGLRNVHDRIQLNYGAEYGLRIESEKDVGTKIVFLLPFNLP